MIVLNDPPTCSITFAGPTVVDLAPYVSAATVDRAAEQVDARTFGKPRRSRMGGGIDTITLALKWDPDLMDDLDAHAQEEGTFELVPVAGGKTITTTVRYGVAPFGTFKPGEAVEVDLVLAVTGSLDWEV